MENLILSFHCVLPMFLMISLGILIRNSRVVPPTVFEPMSIMTFQFLLPFLLFYNVYSTHLGQDFQPDLVVFLLSWILFWFVLSYVVFTHFEPNPKTRGAYIQTSFRSNTAVIGLSLAQTLVSQAGIAPRRYFLYA